MADIPGLSTAVNPRLDRFGEPVTRPGGKLNRMLNIFPGRPETVDPAADLLTSAGMGAVPARPVYELALGHRRPPIQLTPPDALTLGQARGKVLRSVLDPLTKDPRFLALPSDEQQRLITTYVERARAKVKDRAVGAAVRKQPLTLERLLGR